jgi:hypothetical protein
VRLDRCLITSLSLLIALAVLTRPCVAAGPDVKSQVARLFDSGTKNTPPAVAAAKSQFEALQRVAPKGSRLGYAYGVVLANQHKYREALPLIARYLEANPSDLEARHVKIWILVQDRKYSDAMEGLVDLSRQLQADPGDSHASAARFIGTMMGYLELARPGVVETDRKSAWKDTILFSLKEDDVPAFEEGRNAVAARFMELQSTRRAVQEKVTAAEEERKKQTEAALEDDKTKIATQEQAMQSNLEQLSEAQREFNLVQQQLNSLNADRMRLSAQISLVQSQLWQLTTPTATSVVNDQRTPGSTAPTVVTQNTTYNSMSMTQMAQARALSFSLASLNKQAFDMDRQLLALRQRAEVLSGTGERESQSLAQREAAVRQAAKHARIVEKKLQREASSPTKTSSGALTSQMTALSTYSSFPYEQEKKRVLGWFEKK